MQTSTPVIPYVTSSHTPKIPSYLLSRLTLLWPRQFRSIRTLKINNPINMALMIQFLKKNWLKIILLLLLFLAVFLGFRALGDRSVVIGNPDNIVVISPDQSQDVIVIGDPDHIKVKPKSR